MYGGKDPAEGALGFIVVAIIVVVVLSVTFGAVVF